jgi:hypothetical protein
VSSTGHCVSEPILAVTARVKAGDNVAVMYQRARRKRRGAPVLEAWRLGDQGADLVEQVVLTPPAVATKGRRRLLAKIAQKSQKTA